MNQIITLVPRYGRDYKSRVEVEQAFRENKDFTVADMSSQWNGLAANRPDLAAAGIKTARIRYRRNTQVVSIEVSA